MAQNLGRIWEELLVELQYRIISFLDPNDLAATAKLICKAAAARYSGPRHTRIRLSQPVPSHAFAHRWGRHEAMHSLSYNQRRQLLCLTAASGSIPNLQILLPLVGCALGSDVCAAAASAGHLGMCQWLRQQGCPWDNKVLKAAGRSGSRALCDWLIAGGCPGDSDSALEGAASAGHVGLVDQLLASYGPPENSGSFVAAVAGGCDLPALRRLHVGLVPAEEEEHQLAGPIVLGRIKGLVDAAAGSPTPDWREKLEWLAAQGCQRSSWSCVQTTRCPDALDRLTWLAQHGWQVETVTVAKEAAELGNVEALQFALEEQGRQGGQDPQAEARGLGNSVIEDAAWYGQLAALQHLHGRGCSMEPASRYAASHGHLHVVAWLVGTLGAGAVLSEEVFVEAAGSSSLPLLT